ncbi:MAG: lipid-A-disaccharide synthase [Myxococcota bacterium]
MNSDSLLIIGGEASADSHGARVMTKLRSLYPDLHIFGVGGSEMRAVGMEVIAPAEDMAVAGLTEVLWALPRIIRIRNRLLAAVDRLKPKAAVLIDHPDFNLRLARKLKARGVKVVYFISPQVWAWREKRVNTIRALVDRMLVILPFEEEFYAKHGVNAEFVGHPLVEELESAPAQEAARIDLGLPLSEGPIVALLPGSRRKEVTRHLPVMLESVRLLRERYPSLEAVLPIASTIPKSLIEPMIGTHKVRIVDGQAIDVLSAADAAVVASGTASLQAALLAKPIVVVYRVSWLTYQILRRMIRVAHIAMINLIAGRALVPELIQNTFTPRNVYDAVVDLIDNRDKRKELVAELSAIRDRLGRGKGAERVAEVVAGYIGPERQLSAGEPSV